MPTAEEAIAQNLAFRQANGYDTSPAAMGISSTNIASAQALLNQQDAANEQAIHDRAWQENRNDVRIAPQAELDKYANQSSVGSGGATRQTTTPGQTSSNPYNPNSAAGISWDIEKSGGTVGANLSAKSSAEGYTPQYYQPVDQSTVPSRDLSYQASLGVLIPEQSVYYPTEQHGQVKTQIFGDTYLNPASGEMTTFTPVYDQNGKVRNIQNISGGAGAYGAQSGEMTFSPQGAIILNQNGSLNKELSPSNYQDILDNPNKYSRGGEAYYGKVMPLDSKHLLNTYQTITPEYGSQDWWNQTVTARKSPDTQMDTGSFGNQIGIMMYPKGTNAANYMIKGSENYVKGTTYPSDFTLKDQGYDFNNGNDRRSVAGGYEPTAESEMVWGKTVTFTPPTQQSGKSFGNLESIQGWVKNPNYVKETARDTSGDLTPRMDLYKDSPFATIGMVQKTTPYESELTTKAKDPWNAGANSGGSAFEKGVPIQNSLMSAFTTTPLGASVAGNEEEKIKGDALSKRLNSVLGTLPIVGLTSSPNLVGSKKVGGVATVTSIQSNEDYINSLPAPFRAPEVTTVSKSSENWVQGVPLIGGALSAADSASREHFGVGIFAKTSEITQPGYSDLARGLAPIETTTTKDFGNTVVDRSSVKNAGAEWSATFIGSDNKPTQQLDIPIKTTYIKDANLNTITTTEYESHDLSKVVLSVQDKSTTVGASPYQQKYNSALEGFQSYLPSNAEGERGMQVASLANPFTTPFTTASLLTEKFNPAQKDQAQMVESLVGMRGQYTQFHDDPLMSAGGFVLGVGMGAGTRGVVEVGKLARIPLADAAIANGGKYRSALQASDYVSDVVTKGAPYVFGAMYAADIGMRSTTDGISYSSVGKAKGIFMQEGVPMGVGGMLGYGGFSAFKSTPTTVAPKEVSPISEGFESQMTPRAKGLTGKLAEGEINTEQFDYFSGFTKQKPTTSGMGTTDATPRANNIQMEPVGVGDRFIATKSPLGKNVPMVMEQMWSPTESTRPMNIGDSFPGNGRNIAGWEQRNIDIKTGTRTNKPTSEEIGYFNAKHGEGSNEIAMDDALYTTKEEANTKLPATIQFEGGGNLPALKRDQFTTRVVDYIGVGASNSNAVIRGDKSFVKVDSPEDAAYGKAIARTLIIGMDSFGDTIPAKTQLYRGVSRGDYLDDPALQSWSTSSFVGMKFAGKEGTILSYSPSKPIRGVDVSKISKYSDSEKEIILSPRSFVSAGTTKVPRENLVLGLSGSEYGATEVGVTRLIAKGEPVSKEDAIAYVKNRYPNQPEIWNDYLTETQMIGRKGTRKNLDYPDSTYKVQSKEVTTPKTEVVEFTPKYKKLPPTWSPEAWNPELFNAEGSEEGSGDGGAGAISRGFSGSGAKAKSKPATQVITTFDTKTVQSLSKSPVSESAISKSRVVSKTRSQSLAKEMSDAFAVSATKSRSKSKPAYNVADYDSSDATGMETSSGAFAMVSGDGKSRGMSRFIPNIEGMSRSEPTPIGASMSREASNSRTMVTPFSLSSVTSEATSRSMSIGKSAAGARGISTERSNTDGLSRFEPSNKNINKSNAREVENSRTTPYAFSPSTSRYSMITDTRGTSITTPKSTPTPRSVTSPTKTVTPNEIGNKPDIVIPPRIVVPPLGGLFGGSSSPDGGKYRGRGAHREIIGIRSSLDEFFGPNTSRLTKRRGRNF